MVPWEYTLVILSSTEFKSRESDKNSRRAHCKNLDKTYLIWWPRPAANLESYRYDLYGTPSYFNSTSQPINSSTVGVTDLYAGERWMSEMRVYDLRNRFMSPDLGRFLQTDPIGFKGDASNLGRVRRGQFQVLIDAGPFSQAWPLLLLWIDDTRN
jgi:RHS repeat-associated protein